MQRTNQEATPALIGKSLKVKGEISGSGDLYIDGELDGAVELPDHTVTVGPNGNVNANVIARNIVVHGTLQGNALAGESIEIRATGSLLRDLITTRITIEEGAYFKGSVDIVRPGQEEEKPKVMVPHAGAAEARSSR